MSSPTKKRVMFVDDERPVLNGLARTLRNRRDSWDITLLDEPKTAYRQLCDTTYDALVTDLRMPGMDGLELIARVQQHPQHRGMPVVVMTGVDDAELKEKALERGAIDLLNKPVSFRQLTARLDSLIRWKHRQDELEDLTAHLQGEVQRQQSLLARQRLEVVFRLGMVAEHRDTETGNHVVRVAAYSRLLAEALGLSREQQRSILLAAPLHDIGKIAVPDAILFKPGPLAPGEWAVMQKHCVFGEQILRGRASVMTPLLNWYQLETPDEGIDPLLDAAASIALTHHEKWDGSGYPLGLKDEDIPLFSRIVAVSDVFDAISTERPYKRAIDPREAAEMIRHGSGNHFDPQVVQAFDRVFDQLLAVARQIADSTDVFAREEAIPI